MTTFEKILPIVDFLASGLYTPDMHAKIGTCSSEDINRFLDFNNMYDSTPLTVNKFFNTHYNESLYDIPHMSIIVEQENIISYIYDASSLNILFNSTKKYIFKPIFCKLDMEMHLMMMIIDIKKRSIYIFDSNNDITLVKYIENIINITLYENKFKRKFKIIPLEKWNSKNISLNSRIFGSGFCVILSILFSHYIQLSNKSFSTCIKIFGSFSDNERLSLLNDYSLFYYYFIH